MPNMANLVLKDGAATPTNHTYSVIDAAGGKGNWVELIGSDLKNPKLSVGIKKIKVNGTQNGINVNQVYRETINLVLPVTGTSASTGREELLRTLSGNLVLNLPDTSTEQERTDLAALICSAVNDALVSQVHKKLLPMF